MKVKDLIILLQTSDQEQQVVVANDEELNNVYEKFEIAVLQEGRKDRLIIYPTGGLIEQ